MVDAVYKLEQPIRKSVINGNIVSRTLQSKSVKVKYQIIESVEVLREEAND